MCRRTGWAGAPACSGGWAGGSGPGFSCRSSRVRRRPTRSVSRRAGSRGRMDADEVGHARTLRRSAPAEGQKAPTIARLEGRHRATAGNALRAAVLGANDGLLSNLSLIMGVAGASLAAREIVITGSPDCLPAQIHGARRVVVGAEFARTLPAADRGGSGRRSAPIPTRRGRGTRAHLPGQGTRTAQAVARGATHGKGRRGARHARAGGARHRSGELGGSALQAASPRSCCSPLARLFRSRLSSSCRDSAVVASLVASAAGLFGIGAGITVLTGRSVWMSGTRQVVVGIAASALTFGIGRLIGVSLQ